MDRDAALVKSYAWQGLDEPRFELVFVEAHDERLTAQGTQIGTDYRLTYALETADAFVSERLTAECQTGAGTKTIELRRGRSPLTDDVLDLDLGFSPLFNTLPVLRDRLHRGGAAHDYRMAWIDVPTLDVAASDQRYIPLDEGVVRYRSGSFAADIRFDEDGFVLEYPGLARRVG